MYTALLAVGAAFALIVLGWLFRQRHFPGDSFWEGAEKLTYFLLLPALLFRSIADADMRAIPSVGTSLAVVLVSMTLQSLLATAFWKSRVVWLSREEFASYHQGTVRFNNYIGTSVVLALTGTQGLALYALLIALAIPLSNVLTIVVMARFAHGNPGWRSVTRQVITNPLIIASVLGIIVNQAGVADSSLLHLVHLLAQAALPLGLMCVGASVELAGIRHRVPALMLACVQKLLLYPLLAGGIALGAGLEDKAVAVVVLFAALPCASSCHILSRAMGADVPIMARITALTTFASFVTLPLVMFVVSQFLLM